MSEQSVFILSDEEYKKSINPVSNYIKQSAYYVSKMKGIPLEEATQYVRSRVKENLKDPVVKFFNRKENLDREVLRSSLLSYFNFVDKNNKILAPTFTVYLHPSERQSRISSFTIDNIKIRAKSKKEAQAAKARGDMVLFMNKNNEQNNKKIINNSVSGSYGQDGCILYNPTSHSTLTSVTRSVSSLANSNNEKFLYGNRYYESAQSVLNNCVYITSNIDRENTQAVINKYKLHYPSVEDCVKVLKYSSDLYWRDDEAYKNIIIPYLEKLSPEELASICYVGDFYTLRVFNEEFIKTFIAKLSQRVIGSEIEDVAQLLFKTDENLMNYVHQLWFKEMKGRGKNYSEINDKQLLYNLYATAMHVNAVLDEYRDFIRCFFITFILPSNHSKIKQQLRRAVVLSDTDSTCFTVDKWVQWYFGKFKIDEEAIAVSATVAYLCTQLIAHLLSILSAHFNVDKSHLHMLTMKNEFMWLAHMPSEVSKHYAALTAMQEGSIFAEEELEIKGVHFINSAVPPMLTKEFKDYMKTLLTNVVENKPITASEVLQKVILIEKVIIDEILNNNNMTLMKKTKIKDKAAYSLDETKSPYQRHTFWKEIFDGIYPDIPEPPYDVIKIPTTLNNRVALMHWIDTIENEELALRLKNWVIKNDKKNLPTLYINEQFVLSYGIPKEIIPIFDIKRVVLDLTIQYRLMLNALGFMFSDEMLISESYFFK